MSPLLWRIGGERRRFDGFGDQRGTGVEGLHELDPNAIAPRQAYGAGASQSYESQLPASNSSTACPTCSRNSSSIGGL